MSSAFSKPYILDWLFNMSLAQPEVMDAFLGFCDLSSGNPSMILGSCQIAAVKEDTVIGPEMRKLTLEELWGDFGSSGDVEGSSDEDARLAQQSLVFRFFFSQFIPCSTLYR